MLREHEAGATVAGLCRKHGMSSATCLSLEGQVRRDGRYEGLDLSDARRLKALEEENAELKRLHVDAMLDNAALKDLLAKVRGRCGHCCITVNGRPLAL